ncbi:MAG: DJ-1/PfpI family protein [Candidatus Hodarchaeota archaeon]
MNKKLRIILVGFFSFTFIAQLFFFFYLSEMRSAYNQGMSIRGTDIVFFVADGYSEADLLGVKEYLDEWHGNVIIAGLSNYLVSSTNEESVTPDIQISDINEITLYDAIVIPGGDFTLAFNSDQHLNRLLNDANDQELVIAGIGNGTLIQAEAGLIDGKKFTTQESIVINLTTAGGILVDGATVVTDGTIITASPPNYEEFSYAIANALGYTYNLAIDISINKEEQGWKYFITVDPSDKHIISRMNLNLSRDTSDEKIFIDSFMLSREKDGVFTTDLGILANGYYVVDIKAESIYGNVEVRTGVKEFSVGSN